jgi:hypothetical protein
MDFVLNYWYVILGIVAIFVCAGLAVYKFFGLPTKAQKDKIKEWLLYAVSKAEMDLGGGTGILKLRFVYDMFVARFPMAAQIISFKTFEFWVDEALIELKKLLAKNTDVKQLIEGD